MMVNYIPIFHCKVIAFTSIMQTKDKFFSPAQADSNKNV